MAELAKVLTWCISAAIGISLLVFWAWMLVHAINNKGLKDVEKVIWVLVIIFTQLIGALIYFFFGRPKAGYG